MLDIEEGFELTETVDSEQEMSRPSHWGILVTKGALKASSETLVWLASGKKKSHSSHAYSLEHLSEYLSFPGCQMSWRSGQNSIPGCNWNE